MIVNLPADPPRHPSMVLPEVLPVALEPVCELCPLMLPELVELWPLIDPELLLGVWLLLGLWLLLEEGELLVLLEGLVVD